MKSIFLSFALMMVGLSFAATPIDHDQILMEIVKESILNYKGICPCPYSTHPDARQCGYRSAFSSKSGSVPVCYSITVTPKMIEDYKERHKP